MTNTLAIDRSRCTRGLVALAAASAILLAGAPAVEAVGRAVSVIVTSSDAGSAARLVQNEGGTVTAPLPIIDGVVASVPASRLAGLSTHAFVVADRAIHVAGKSYEKAEARAGDPDSSALKTAAPFEVGATALWQVGLTGAGGSVAMIDTGVAHVADLAGHIVAEANVTKEKTAEDTYGHGTFQAGLIAGDGTSSDGAYMGIAPNTNIVSVKVAGADGSTSLGQVLVGAQIVHRAQKRFNVRTVLLALSSESPLPPELDPLSRALRALWAEGITVVVPAGNEGADGGAIASPGEDPVLLTAGSVNDLGTQTPLDDVVSDYSSHGPTRWGMDKPDVVAPGQHLISLRAPGSTVDQANPQAVVDDAYFKGSGTSMSSAVTAAVASLVAEAHPEWSPDQIKAALMATANPLPDADFSSQGAGIVDASQAIFASPPSDLPDAPDMSDAFDNGDNGNEDFDARSWGSRSWDARQWAARQWAARTWDARSWDARTWDARQWAARQWAARTWAARQWAARTWAARQWDSRSWDARTWDSRTWDSRSWASRQWAARQWDSRTWDSRTWASRQWASRQWDSRTWEARQWDSRTWASRQWDSRQWDSRSWESRQWDSRQWSSRQWDSVDWT